MQWLPSGWKPKVVAVDIDGTLTDENKCLHSGAIESLRRLEENGIPVILCTGNVRAITYGLWRFLQLSGPMVSENGGVVWHPSWPEPIVRADGTKAKQAARWLATRIEGLDPVGIESNAWRESEWCLRTKEDDERIKQELADSQWRDLLVVRTGFAIHLTEPHLTKGEGLQLALDRIGISPDEVLAIGDAPNDIPMFELVKHSVAVGGSFESLQEVASVNSPLMRAETFAPLVDEVLRDY